MEKERTDAEVDARLRKKLQTDVAAAERQTRVASAISSKAKALEAHLVQWKSEGVISASNYTLQPPAQSPLGAPPVDCR